MTDMDLKTKNSILHVMKWTGVMSGMRHFGTTRFAIIMLHDVQRDHAGELMTGTPAALLECILSWLRAHGWHFVSLDRLIKVIGAKEDNGRYAAITFDDGYRDLPDVALPILERNNAPFTMFVPTGAVTRTLESWWLGLRELVRKNEQLNIEGMDRSLPCSDYRSKLSAFAAVSRWVHQDYNRAARVLPVFRKAGISLTELNEKYFMSEQQFKVLARHPLASVGGHTSSHHALSILDTATARKEVEDNKDYLERLGGTEVRHFAYPYGTSTAFGFRDQCVVRSAGFDSAVSARNALVDDADENMFALPRVCVGGPSGSEISFEAEMSGIRKLMRGCVSSGTGPRPGNASFPDRPKYDEDEPLHVR